jgi:hypothetical protein
MSAKLATVLVVINLTTAVGLVFTIAAAGPEALSSNCWGRLASPQYGVRNPAAGPLHLHSAAKMCPPNYLPRTDAP